MTILYYVRDMALTMLCALPLWAAARWIWLKRGNGPVLWGREVLLALFVLYLAALMGQTVLPELLWTDQGLLVQPWPWGGCNYIPFATIRQMWFEMEAPVYVAVNLLGNVLVFAPLGLLPPMIWKGLRKALPVLVLGGGCSLCIELLQPLVGRNRDVDDLILNTLGCALGYLLWKLGQRMRKLL